MKQEQAAELLREVRILRQRTRESLWGLWFSCVVFGVLSVASAGVALTLPSPAMGAYWLGAVPLGMILIGRHQRRSGEKFGFEPGAIPRVAVTAVAVIVVGCAVTGGLGGALGADRLAAMGPPLCVSAGYLIFARMFRDATFGILAAILGLLAVVLGLTLTPVTATAVLAFLYGATFIVTGLRLRSP